MDSGMIGGDDGMSSGLPGVIGGDDGHSSGVIGDDYMDSGVIGGDDGMSSGIIGGDDSQSSGVIDQGVIVDYCIVPEYEVKGGENDDRACKDDCECNGMSACDFETFTCT